MYSNIFFLKNISGQSNRLWVFSPLRGVALGSGGMQSMIGEKDC